MNSFTVDQSAISAPVRPPLLQPLRQPLAAPATPSRTETAAPTRWVIVSWLASVHLLALYALPGFTWANLGLALGLWFVSGCLGITLGFHRLMAHRSFKTSKPLTWFFALCGTLAFQGGALEWVARHRMHHAFTDTDDDPHNARKGFWHSHILWLFQFHEKFDSPARHHAFARDISRDPVLRFLSNTVVMSVLQGILLFSLAYFLGWDAALWGVFVRLLLGYHSTWLVNSAAHKFGYRSFETTEDSKNCWWVALLTFGEGWHNNHHADQRACRSGRRFWEFDPTYLIIKALASVGLIWDIEEPKEELKT